MRRILLISIGCVLMATSLPAQKETFVPANDVSFTISTERRSYKAGERIILKYRIVNVSKGSLYAPREWEAKCGGRPHVWAWFENSVGQHFTPGYAGSCDPDYDPKSVTERMSKEAILLKPREHVDGTFQLETNLFSGLKPGAYRVEGVLYCWRDDEFTDVERSDLEKMPWPFLRGEVPASVHITLTP